MRNYRLKEGAMSVVNGVTYRSGDIACSNRDLVKMWPTRFELAPEGFKSDRWDSRINDVVGADDYAVITLKNNFFKIVDRKGKTVDGCNNMSKEDAFKKYLTLTAKPAKKAVKEEEPEEESPEEPEEKDEEQEEEAEEEPEEEEEQEEKPAKKKKKKLRK